MIIDAEEKNEVSDWCIRKAALFLWRWYYLNLVIERSILVAEKVDAEFVCCE